MIDVLKTFLLASVLLLFMFIAVAGIARVLLVI